MLLNLETVKHIRYKRVGVIGIGRYVYCVLNFTRTQDDNLRINCKGQIY